MLHVCSLIELYFNIEEVFIGVHCVNHEEHGTVHLRRTGNDWTSSAAMQNPSFNSWLRRHLQRAIGCVIFLAIFAVDIVTEFDNEERNWIQCLRGVFLLRSLVVIVLLLFPLAAPLHWALGYYNQEQVEPFVIRDRLDSLAAAKITIWAVNLFICCVVTFVVGGAFAILQQNASIISSTVRLLCIFPLAITLHGAMLVVVWTMAALIDRLILLEESVEEALGASDSFVRSYNSTSSGDIENLGEQALQWVENYRSIRLDVDCVSKNFGSLLLSGILLFILDMVSRIVLVWKQPNTGSDMLWSKASVISQYLPNAAMIVAALLSTAYLVTKCKHSIGPKIATLAARHSEIRQLSVLTTMFLHAPMSLRVGSFAFNPEFSHVIALILFGLLLLATFGPSMS